jgi:hypothetical protein
MTTTPLSVPHGTGGARPPASVSLIELPSLLATAKDARLADWQEVVARHVSVLIADYPKQSDDKIALRELSLILLAARKGSTDAKKRVLKAARWTSTTPPAISDALESPDEARAAMRLLEPLRASWAVGYIQRELTANRWPSIAGDLVAWKLRASASVEAFLAAVNSTEIPAGEGAPGWIDSVLRAALKLLPKVRHSSGSGFMAEIERLAARVSAGSGADPAADQKERRAAQKGVATLISQRSSIEPAILLQGGAIAAVRAVAAMSKPPDTGMLAECETICRRLISVLGALVPLGDRAFLLHLRSLWGAFRECTPRAEPLLKAAIRDNPTLRVLESSDDDALLQGETAPTAPLEGIVTELMSNWDSYFVQHHADPAVQQLSLRIEDMVKQLGILRFGVEGEVVPFDPFRHRLPGATPMPPAKVLIKRPGIALHRPDGTSRVLLPAIVSPVERR